MSSLRAVDYILDERPSNIPLKPDIDFKDDMSFGVVRSI